MRYSSILAAAIILLPGGWTAFAQEGETVAPAVSEQVWSGEVEAVNRWVQDTGGSRDVYRSIVNLGEGPRVSGGNLRYRNPSGKLADRFDLRGTAWGGDPYNTASLEAGRAGLYELRLDYRNVAYFNSLPSFANPLLNEGLLVSQRALDINRRNLDLDLKFHPGAKIEPFFAYSHAAGFGRGITTFVTDGNEFPVSTDLDDRTNTVRGGLNINFTRYNFTLEHGGATYGDDQEIFFDDGGNRGNRRTTLLGRQIVLDGLRQIYDIEGKTIFNRAVAQGRPWDRLNFTGQFLYSRPRIDAVQTVDASGDFVFLRAVAPYTGQFERSMGDASRPHSSGSWTTELRPFQRLRVVQSFYTDRFHVSGGSLLAQTLNTTPATETELTVFDTLILNYSQHQIDAIVEAGSRVSLRGGHRYVWGDAQVRPASLQLGAEPRNTGEMRRHVGLGGASIRATANLIFTADIESSPGDRTFFRTGLMDYTRGKAMARYRLRPSLTFTGSFSMLDNQNDAEDIGFDFRSQQTSASIYWSPDSGRRFTLMGDYARSTIRSDIPIVTLPFLGRENISYRDLGHHGGVYAEVSIHGDARLTLGGSYSINTGSRPTRYYQPQAKIAVPVAGKVSWIAEWRWFGFTEERYAFENFHTHVFAAGIRIGL